MSRKHAFARPLPPRWCPTEGDTVWHRVSKSVVTAVVEIVEPHSRTARICLQYGRQINRRLISFDELRPVKTRLRRPRPLTSQPGGT